MIVYLFCNFQPGSSVIQKTKHHSIAGKEKDTKSDCEKLSLIPSGNDSRLCQQNCNAWTYEARELIMIYLHYKFC